MAAATTLWVAMADEMDVIVTPGEEICEEAGFVRGHGTFLDGNMLKASVAGRVSRVNMLVSVKAQFARYAPEVGDVVVGRVTSVEARHWRVDIGARQDATLMLASVNLRGGAQRRRTFEDQLQMRSYFKEGDVLSADVHNVLQDGSISLHARSLKYGKLEQGVLVQVRPGLVPRLRQHFVTLKEPGVDAVFGLNGKLWLSKAVSKESVRAALTAAGTGADSRSGSVEQGEARRRIAREQEVTAEDRERLARVHNAVLALQACRLPVEPDTVLEAFRCAERSGWSAAHMLGPEAQGELAAAVRSRIRSRLARERRAERAAVAGVAAAAVAAGSGSDDGDVGMQ